VQIQRRLESDVELIDDGITPLRRGAFLSRGELRGAVPGQDVINPVDRMLGDLGQHMAQLGFGGDAVELGRANQRVDGGGALASAVGAGEQVVAATDGDTTQGPLGG